MSSSISAASPPTLSQRGALSSEAGIENEPAPAKVYTICDKNTPNPNPTGAFVSSIL
jgi:hypothetical protein